jgi:hypothetical protein
VTDGVLALAVANTDDERSGMGSPDFSQLKVER